MILMNSIKQDSVLFFSLSMKISLRIYWNIELILFTWRRQDKSLLQVICVSLPLRRKIVTSGEAGTVIFEKLTGGISLTFCNKESYACVAPGHGKPVSVHTA